jgi:hypothetical protein
MNDRLFEPTATKMATFSLGKAAAATPRENNTSTSQPPNLPRASTADKGRKWNGQNPPDRSRDLRILPWQPPHRRKSTTSSQSMPSGTTEPPTDDGTGRVRPEPSWGVEEAPSKASQMPGNPSMQPTNQIWVQRDPPHLIEDEEGLLSQHIIPQSPHGTDRLTSTPPRGQWGNSQRTPINRGDHRRLLSSLGSQSTISSDTDERWSLALRIITPPSRDYQLHLNASDTSPGNHTATTPHRLSFDLISPTQRREERAQWKEGGIFDGTQNNVVWNRGENGRNLIIQFTVLSRLKTIRESDAERRRLLSTTIDHFMYEVILWITSGI